MAENPVEKAIREAEQACQMAISATPEAYRGFITLIPQSKRIGRGPNAPYANIRLPYMTVDGRVKMAMDEHREQHARLTIDTTFEQVADKLVCRAVVNSSVFGHAVGHSIANIGGSGVDSSNPLENAETSAIGRALGFLGYGLFGTGIASAEEVLSAMATRTELGPEPELGPELGPVVPVPHEAPTAKQLGLLHGLLKTVGVLDGDKHKLTEKLTKREASDAIDYLTREKTLPGWLKTRYIKILIGEYGHDRKAVGAYLDEAYGHHDPERLTQGQMVILIQHLVQTQALDPDDIYLPGERPEPTREAWTAFIAGVCTACQLSAKEFETWALAQFGDGTIKDMLLLPAEAYYSLTAMDTDGLAAQVRAFRTDDESQPALIR